MMSQTLDQQRAQFAWERVVKHAGVAGYREAVKGAPALVMGSGLMAALAFWSSRSGANKDAANAVLADVLGWLASRSMIPADFEEAMQAFFGTASTAYMRATDEALAVLKWLRQFADAVDATRKP